MGLFKGMMKSNPSKNRRVVVTGLGVISSIGIGWKEFWKNLIAGKSGINRISAFDTSEYDRHYAGEVKSFDPTQFMSAKKAARMGRASQMSIAASLLALKDAKLPRASLREKITAVSIGTTTGEIQLLENFDDNRFLQKDRLLNNRTVSVFPSSSLSSSIADAFKLKGWNTVFATACASGNYAIGQVFDLIRSGRADFALAGGVDAFSRIVFTGFSRMFAIAPERCQPFDKNRQGMIPGEGAGILLLETLKNAQKRKAHIYAEVLGYGLSCDASHMTISDVAGITKSIQRALASSQIDISRVDYISAHGTGTLENDEAECKAINKVFGRFTPRIPASSIKSSLGHTMGAAAALEAISCCLAIEHHEIPPTINFEVKDKKCDIDCVPNTARKRTVNVALNNSQAFGGNNACVILGNV